MRTNFNFDPAAIEAEYSERIIADVEQDLELVTKSSTGSLDNYEPNGEVRPLKFRYNDLTDLVHGYGEKIEDEYPERDTFVYVVQPEDGTIFDMPIRVSVKSPAGRAPSLQSSVGFSISNDTLDSTTFNVQVPREFAFISTDELHKAGEDSRTELLDDCAKAIIRREAVPELRRVRKEIDRLRERK